MIRLALPKGRNLGFFRAALTKAGVPLEGFDPNGRALQHALPAEGIEILMLKDPDLPLYVERGVADFGAIGSDVLEESGADLLVPLHLVEGGCRLSLIGRPGLELRNGRQLRLATKYPNTARSWLATQDFGAEILPLSGSVELAPVLGLADLALDIVQTGSTLVANGLVELEVVREVSICVVINRGSWQAHRAIWNDLITRLEAVGAVR